MFTVVPIPALKDNYIWMLVDSDLQQAVVVDPGDAKPVLQALKLSSLKLTAILITHHHWDHTNGIGKLLEHYAVPVFGPAREDVDGKNVSLSEGEQVELFNGSVKLSVLDIPGHTHGHIAYHRHGVLFSGDTLFTAGCGRVFEGTPEQMYHSLSKLAVLSEETLVYCGHEYTLANLHFAQVVEPNNLDINERIQRVSVLRNQNLPTVPAALHEEKLTNPFLRCHLDAVKQSAEQHANKKLSSPAEVFAVIRQWKNGF